MYHAGVTLVCELAAQFTDEAWAAPTTCPEWRAADLAGHLRCVADDFHEYLDDAPLSRLSRLMARSPSPESLARKLARQNTAELAALPDATGPEHIAAFAASARAYAARALAVWDLPHHRYGDTVVTVAGVVGAACAEWHLHAWDLAASLGKDYQPAQPGTAGRRLAGGQAAAAAGCRRARGPVRRRGSGARSGRRRNGRAGAPRGAGWRLGGPAPRLRPHPALTNFCGRWTMAYKNVGAVPTTTSARAVRTGRSLGMGLDVSAVRAMYPALADGYAYLDGAAGTQLPAPVIDAISDAYRSGLGNPTARSRPAGAPTRSSPKVGGRLPTWSAGTPRG